MNPFDENPSDPALGPGDSTETEPAATGVSESAPVSAELELPLAGDPISYVAIHPEAAHPPSSNLPEDLRISWSWPHLLLFVAYAFISQIVIGIGVVAYYTAGRHLTERQIRRLFESDPTLIVGTNVLWFALIILFLYVTLSVLRNLPFWQSLGWRKLDSNHLEGKGKPWMYFLSGAGLSLFVIIASSQVKDAEHLPIQEMFKSRSGTMLLMTMAVLVAPLVEETIFRGYLYPVFARIVSGIAQRRGMDTAKALQAGVVTSILTTGVLFGLMHAPQLGWTWELVSLLMVVGIIFTFARAWTGTVFASFLLHLGYNSTLAVLTIIGTKGFTSMPPHP
ncbi:MAG TPA: CPBP family intramembrane glutamic endopeptidase [Candidatus Acidoferrum sp.]|nr:CPBP family intramembrane glutamic endopeptidase [Candidatus Acidoferrum sp.]